MCACWKVNKHWKDLLTLLIFTPQNAGDVFRPPEYPMVLSASVGVGVHLLVTMGLVVLLAISNVFDPTRRGAVLQACGQNT